MTTEQQLLLLLQQIAQNNMEIMKILFEGQQAILKQAIEQR